MEIEGKIILDLGKTEGTSQRGNHWQKREWVLETINTNYPKKVKFHVFGERADQLTFEVGKTYAVSFDVESREFNERWYTDINVYAMRAIEGGGLQPPQGGFSNGGAQSAPNPFGQQMQQPAFDMPAADPTDDLPF